MKSLIILFIFLIRIFHSYAQTISNGNFSYDNNCAASTDKPFIQGCVYNWSASHGSTILGPVPYNGTSNEGAQLQIGSQNSSTINYNSNSGIFINLSLSPNTQYQINYLAGTSSPAGANMPKLNLYVSLANGLTPASSISSVKPTPNNYVLIDQPNIQSNAPISSFTKKFTTPNWSSFQLWIYIDLPINSNVSTTNVDYVAVIGSISITSTCPPQDIYYQNTSSLPYSTRTQGKIFAGSAVTSGTQGPVTTTYAEFLSVGDIALLPGFSADNPASQPSLIFVAHAVDCPTNNPSATACNCLAGSASRPLANVDSSPITTNVATLFPNPTTGQATFNPNQPIPVNTGTFIVYNALGAEVQRINCQRNLWQNGSVVLDLSSLADGFYQYRFVADSYSTKGKFVLQR